MKKMDNGNLVMTESELNKHLHNAYIDGAIGMLGDLHQNILKARDLLLQKKK